MISGSAGRAACSAGQQELCVANFKTMVSLDDGHFSLWLAKFVCVCAHAGNILTLQSLQLFKEPLGTQ